MEMVIMVMLMVMVIMAMMVVVMQEMMMGMERTEHLFHQEHKQSCNKKRERGKSESAKPFFSFSDKAEKI